MRFDPIIQMPTAWSGVHRHVGVHVFEGRVTVNEMQQLDSIGAEWRRKNPGKLVELVVIFPSDHQMTSEERTRMSRLIKRWESERAASATVVLAEGIRGSLHRSVLTGLSMLAPPPHPSKIFGNLADAVVWLAPHVATLWNAKLSNPDLFAGIESFCQEFKSRVTIAGP